MLKQRLSQIDRHRIIGFTLVELLIVISIIALLLAILLPALGKARKQAQATVCLSNLKQIGLVLYMYHDDNNGYISRDIDRAAWFLVFMPYLGENKPDVNDYREVEIYNCPGFPNSGSGMPNSIYGFSDGVPNSLQSVDYVVNAWEGDGIQTKGPTKITKIDKPSDTVYLADNESGIWRPVIVDKQQLENTSYSLLDVWMSSHLPNGPDGRNADDKHARRVAKDRHRQGSNYLFIDSHAEYVATEKVTYRMWGPR